jgi:hypothetical protein
VKGLIILDYQKNSDNYVVNLTLPQDMNAILYVPKGAVVNCEAGNVEIIEK